uniref:Uncharacterized protein n=1 Tax=Anguilla anguilla TaxID=7936 RepID=A0A0E9R295_ANGAN
MRGYLYLSKLCDWFTDKDWNVNLNFFLAWEL